VTTDDTGCTRCDAPLIFLGEQRFHEGDGAFGVLLGSWQELFEDRVNLEMWACQDCGHVEFFMPLKKGRGVLRRALGIGRPGRDEE
jgi:hypothetical protein